MKIIFLDIDGVVNSTRSFLAGRARLDAYKAKDEDVPYYSKLTLCTIDSVAVDMINRILVEADAHIVLSSSHRMHFRRMDISHVQEYLTRLGFIGERCIDVTPVLDNCPRGLEIKTWLDTRDDVECFVIIDDSSDMLDEQEPFFVRTNLEIGLSAEDYRKASKILGKEDTSVFMI